MKALALLAAALLGVTGCAQPPDAARTVGQLVVVARPPGGGGRYLGSRSCRACHPVAYSRWRDTGHAADFAGLPPSARGTTACLRCHVTGYGDPQGVPGPEAEDLASVGCEACHGAGADHARSARPSLVPTTGACASCETNRICRLCHTPEHSAGFELSTALPLISCKP